MIEIYLMDITRVLHDEYAYMCRMVSDERYLKASRYKFEDDKKRCICAEILVRYGLKKHNINECAPIKLNEYGKPYVEFDDCFFSVSHSEKWAGVAFSKSEIGFDIEKSVDNIGGATFFSYDENLYIEGGNAVGKSERFIEVWTRKESYLKYLGCGLHKQLDSFSTMNNRVLDYEAPDNEALLYSFAWNEEYRCSVCSKERDRYIKFFCVSYNELLTNDKLKEY